MKDMISRLIPNIKNGKVCIYNPDDVDPCPDPDPSSDPNSFPDIPYSPDCLPDSLLDDHQQQTTDPSSMHLNPTDPSFDSTGTQLYTDQQLLYSTNPQYSHPYPSYSFDQMCAADPLISQWYPHISFPNPQSIDQNSQNVYDPCWFWNRPFQAVPVQMPRNIPPLQPSSKENLPNQLSQSTVLSKFISEKLPVTKLPSLAPKTSAKVLTSDENLKLIAEKELKKSEAEKKKKERQEKRARAQFEKIAGEAMNTHKTTGHKKDSESSTVSSTVSSKGTRGKRNVIPVINDSESSTVSSRGTRGKRNVTSEINGV